MSSFLNSTVDYSFIRIFVWLLQSISDLITPQARLPDVLTTNMRLSFHKILKMHLPHPNCGAAHFGGHGRCNRGAQQWRSRRTHV